MNNAAGAATHPWPRTPPVAGAHNLRDLGGYATADGCSVKWRRLFRSGRMNDITEEAIAALGVATICDLRDNRERALHPTQWHAGRGIEYWCRDYALSLGDLHQAGAAAAPPAAMYASMIRAYRELPYEQAPAYRALFRRLAAGKLPLLFNCAAGKDRTGIAAALILTALGVPRDTIAADYALTDDSLEQLTAMVLRDPKYRRFNDQPADHYLPLLRADPAYLNAMFKELEHRHGTVTGYLSATLGINPADIAALQENLLEKAER